MRTVKTQCKRLQIPPIFLRVLIMVCVTLIATLAGAQLQPDPHPLDTFLTNILNFKEPTGIRGTFRDIDLEGTIIWLDWQERSDDRPYFQMGWKPVPGDATLAVHPKDLDQFYELQQFRKGAAIEMIIQLDPEGKRRILSYHDLSLPHKVPL